MDPASGHTQLQVRAQHLQSADPIGATRCRRHETASGPRHPMPLKASALSRRTGEGLQTRLGSVIAYGVWSLYVVNDGGGALLHLGSTRRWARPGEELAQARGWLLSIIASNRVQPGFGTRLAGNRGSATVGQGGSAARNEHKRRAAHDEIADMPAS